MPLHEYQKRTYKQVATVLALIILPIAGFFAGVQYQKQTNPAAETNQTARFGGSGPRGMQNRALGEVTDITATSVAITSRFNNEKKTYTITSDTTYKDGESSNTVTASDVKAGSEVMLELNADDTTKVKTITLNPQAMFRGGTQSSGGASL